MKLYYHPVSTVSRPIMLFAADNGIDLDYQIVDLMKGEHMGDAFAQINPNKQVPVLEDNGFRMTESSAILKYLADKVDSPAYPKDPQVRARINEVMDWFNANFYRDWGYGLIYPQLFPHHKRPTESMQSATIAWARDKCKNWLGILDRHIIGDNSYLCGSAISIADYFGAGILSLAEAIRCDFSNYPNVARWYANMKSGRNWTRINEVFYGMVDSLKQQQFESI